MWTSVEWLSSQFLSNQHIPLGQRSSIWKQNLDKVQILHFLKSLCLGQQTCRSAWRLWNWNWTPSPFSWSMKCNLSLLLVYPACRTVSENKDWTLVPGDIWAWNVFTANGQLSAVQFKEAVCKFAVLVKVWLESTGAVAV